MSYSAKVPELSVFCEQWATIWMIVIPLLVLGVRGKSPEKRLMKHLLERAVKDDQASLAECMIEVMRDNPDIYWTDGGNTVAYWQLMGKCAARFPEAEAAVRGAKLCTGGEEERKQYEALAGDEEIDAFCDAWCEEGSADWCSSGLSTGAIVGIVVGAILVVGGIAGALVFFLVIKKRGDQE
jgi:hypothetical protein